MTVNSLKFSSCQQQNIFQRYFNEIKDGAYASYKVVDEGITFRDTEFVKS
jgi:hypothetical protein